MEVQPIRTGAVAVEVLSFGTRAFRQSLNRKAIHQDVASQCGIR
jgi:hypothetical protein